MIRVRFQRLLDVLATIDPQKFNMNTWMVRNSCGTQGCMIGHYVASGAAKHLRFSTRKSGGHVWDVIGPYGSGGFDAIAMEFGIDTQQAVDLFRSRSCFETTGPWQRGPAGLRLAKKRVRDFMRSHA